MRIRPTGARVYQLRVTLRGMKPPIWRRFLVPKDITLRRLHDCLQAVMGWCDGHLHQFKAGGVIYGTRDRESLVHRISETKTNLDKVLRRPKDRLLYEYDFGDGWKHDVLLEKVLPAEAASQFPLVVAGKRACPPEDVGGVHGYRRLLAVLADPAHADYSDLLEWAGGRTDPEEFDVREANLAIHGGWTCP